MGVGKTMNIYTLLKENGFWKNDHPFYGESWELDDDVILSLREPFQKTENHKELTARKTYLNLKNGRVKSILMYYTDNDDYLCYYYSVSCKTPQDILDRLNEARNILNI